MRESRAHEQNNSILIILAILLFISAAVMALAYAKLGFDNGWLTQKQAVAVSGIGMFIGIVASLGMTFAQDNYRNIKSSRGDPPSPPPRNRNADSMLTFNTSQQRPRIELTRGNTIILGKHHPDYGTWGDLGDVLEKHNWRFSRDIIAGSFIRITERYPEIRRDFRHLEFVAGKGANQYMTRAGQTFFIEQSDNLFLEHMRLRK